MSKAVRNLARWRVRLGYPAALACLWLSEPRPKTLLLGALVALPGLILRAAAAGHLHKHEALATSGPYAYTRNPLYLGSAILGAGFAVAAASWWAAAIVAAYFVAFYPAVMLREEQELRERYGAAFEAYAAQVPRFWPRLKPAATQARQFSFPTYLRNREYQTTLGFAVALFLLWLRYTSG